MSLQSAPIDIYIGCTESQALIARVLSASVERRTGHTVRFFPLYQHAIDFEMPANPDNRPGTPFSFHRFMIPEITGFSGRAIYMDCDQIVLKDVVKLAHRTIGASGVSACDTRRKGKPKATKRSSMMLIDCERVGWRIEQIVADLDAERYSYKSLFSLKEYNLDLPRGWNALDTYRWPRTALLHYTDKYQQPWINHTHRLGHLWMRELFHAIDAGKIEADEVQRAVDDQLVRPSLAYQVEHRIDRLSRLPETIKAEDEPFLSACRANNFNNVPGEYGVHRDAEATG